MKSNDIKQRLKNYKFSKGCNLNKADSLASVHIFENNRLLTLSLCVLINNPFWGGLLDIYLAINLHKVTHQSL